MVFFVVSCFQFCSLTAIKDESPKINTVENGTKFKINLPEDHSSGYLWQLGENYDHSKIKNCGAVWHGVEKGIDLICKPCQQGKLRYR